jgi:Zn-finger nucleic acid-binding protein
MPYTQFSQIDYTLCKRCGGVQEDARADEYIRQEQEEKQKLKEKQIRNEKQRKYYYSEKAIEKRRLKKIELQELRAKQHEESVKLLSSIFKDMFKHM